MIPGGGHVPDEEHGAGVGGGDRPVLERRGRLRAGEAGGPGWYDTGADVSADT